jgi:hypothetical protein
VSLSVREAADQLNISQNTARRWIKSGKLKARLQEGFYGPEYIVEESEITRIQTQFSPQVTVVQSTGEESSIEVPTQWLLGQLEDRLSTVVRGAVRDQVEVEMTPLRVELAALRHDNEVLRETLEKRMEERDRKLVETMKILLEVRREEAADAKPWWQRVFGKR